MDINYLWSILTFMEFFRKCVCGLASAAQLLVNPLPAILEELMDLFRQLGEFNEF